MRTPVFPSRRDRGEVIGYARTIVMNFPHSLGVASLSLLRFVITICLIGEFLCYLSGSFSREAKRLMCEQTVIPIRRNCETLRRRTWCLLTISGFIITCACDLFRVLFTFYYFFYYVLFTFIILTLCVRGIKDVLRFIACMIFPAYSSLEIWHL